ncbi:hypothetical protein M427DRAFT_138328 [Gonapodya prolifera JEL478]|uniref:Uncharacterized protein n=1 Tax=Gonapodya prolifera (strain JEL478) TaxID=1344416 RepID=A0A139A4I1_GONPJ|nr:hypothetical protein M427DRAFT_138328 [Gonapodya prolifera JEL478]|eukprot:KXS11385.1 hypothetical protein M427DRAFT_138328 [Gonapodya prolifera JEL478]
MSLIRVRTLACTHAQATALCTISNRKVPLAVPFRRPSAPRHHRSDLITDCRQPQRRRTCMSRDLVIVVLIMTLTIPNIFIVTSLVPPLRRRLWHYAAPQSPNRPTNQISRAAIVAF